MITVYRKIFDFMDPRQRRRFVLLMGLMVVVAFAEILGISFVLLLLRLFAQPEQMLENTYLRAIYDTLGFTSLYAFQIFLSVAVFVVVMLGLVIKAFGNYAITRFSAMQGYTMSSRLLQVFLRQPYTWFLTRNSADISKSVLGEVDQLVMRVMVPANKLLANLMLAVAIVLFITSVDPVVALTAAALMSGAYMLIYLRLRGMLTRIGKVIMQANSQRFRLTSEAIGGFKEVKLMNLEDDYIRRFNAPSLQRARYTSLSQVVGELPRFALEAISFGVLIVIILLLLLRNGGDFLSSVPTLGIIALSVMKLMPAMQAVYSAVASLRGASVLLDTVHAEYIAALTEVQTQGRSTQPNQRLDLVRDLKLHTVAYSYPAAQKAALKEIDLRIPARTTVGIVGGTGAGKTTLVDLILGLLTPDSGQVLVDGTPITRDNVRAWQKSLGYVPQMIYLVDDSVTANIAFGVPPQNVDMAAVERAARVASLHDFVMGDLPEGYKTMVGERGVRLSGGQRQRIGIARALYHNPSLLVLDEATSALDNITERAVMEAMHNLHGEKTVIMIAHRLSTVRNCDVIFLLEQGRVAASGTYEDLVEGNEIFRRMAVNG